MSIAVPLLDTWTGAPTGRIPCVRPTAIEAVPEGRGRVVLLCLDGASLDVISPAVAAGRLPNFGRILDRGASMHLATTRPTQPEPVWASVMTGMWPSEHGVRGSAQYRPFNGDAELDVLPDYLFSQALIRLGLLIEEPYCVGESRRQPLWQIAERYGVPTGLIGLPLTHPAETPRGFIVSDRFHRRATARPSSMRDRRSRRRRLMTSRAAILAAEQDQPGREPCPPRSAAAGLAESGSTVEADRLHHLLAQTAGIAWSRFGCLRFATPDSTPSATTTCATRIPTPMATCRRTSGVSSAGSSTTTTRMSIRSSAMRCRRSARTICCSWCPASAWSR